VESGAFNGTATARPAATTKSSATEDGLIGVPYHSFTFFGFANYRINPDLGVSMQLNYGTLGEQNHQFRPAEGQHHHRRQPVYSGDHRGADGACYDWGLLRVLARWVARPRSRVGTNNLVRLRPFRTRPSTAWKAAWSRTARTSCAAKMGRAVLTVNGALGGDWSWTAYVQTGQMRELEDEPGDALNTNYNNAVDAVVVTANNREVPRAWPSARSPAARP